MKTTTDGVERWLAFKDQADPGRLALNANQEKLFFAQPYELLKSISFIRFASRCLSSQDQTILLRSTTLEIGANVFRALGRTSKAIEDRQFSSPQGAEPSQFDVFVDDGFQSVSEILDGSIGIQIPNACARSLVIMRSKQDLPHSRQLSGLEGQVRLALRNKMQVEDILGANGPTIHYNFLPMSEDVIIVGRAY
jgi:hypothetical protein